MRVEWQALFVTWCDHDKHAGYPRTGSALVTAAVQNACKWTSQNCKLQLVHMNPVRVAISRDVHQMRVLIGLLMDCMP